MLQDTIRGKKTKFDHTVSLSGATLLMIFSLSETYLMIICDRVSYQKLCFKHLKLSCEFECATLLMTFISKNRGKSLGLHYSIYILIKKEEKF